MKKLLALLLAMLMIVGVLASCGGGNKDNDDLPDDDKEQNEENEQGGNGDNGNVKIECNHRGGTATCTKKAVCSLCNEEYGNFNYSKHVGGTATCVSKAVCADCGKAYGGLDPQKHTGELKLVESSGNHKNIYDCCGEAVGSEEEHDWSDGVCQDCLYECKHSFGFWNATKEPSCTEEGTKNRTCTICSKVEECTIEVLEHQYVTVGEIKDCGGNTVFEAEICIECGYTENLLADGETVVIHPHSFVRREPYEPTCTEEGCSVWFECENCGYDVKETIDKLGHLWSKIYYQYDEFYHVRKCTRDQCKAEDKSLHIITDWRLISTPTCTQNGSIGGYCVDCGEWCTRVLPASHNYDSGEITKEPTCIEKGTVLYTCTECGHTKEADVAPLGHNFQNYVLSNSNPDNPCEHVSDCSRCDAKDYKTIHDDGPWNLTNNPDNICEHSKECSRCERIVYETIHNFDNGTITKEPTCLESGNKLYVCQRCELEKNQILSAYGHDEEICAQKEPTCTENGYTVYRCKRCDNLRTVHHKALGHNAVYEHDDDCHWKKCMRCKKVLSIEELHKLEVKFDKQEKATETIYSLYYFCDTCEYKRIIKEGVAHVHNEAEIIKAVAPTCTECGYLPGLKCATEGCEDIFIEPEAIDALGHAFGLYNICIRCGYEKHSEGLNYILSEDETYYVVTGIGTCTDIHINIPSVYNENPVKEIASNAFYNKDAIVSVKIPSSVTSIGEGAFEWCNSLTSVTIPDSVTSIGDYAFYECYKLVEVINKSNLNITKGSYNNGYVAYYALEVHNSKSKIVNKDGYLFYTVDGTNYLVNYIGTDTDITLPANYNGENYVITRYAFYENNSLTNVTIPDSVTSIGYRAFYGCISLTSVTIPDSVTSIGNDAFYNTGYYKNKSNWENGILYIDKYVIEAKTDISGAYTIKAGTKLIADSAFYNCDSLTSVTISDSVTSIGDYAFYSCDSLTSVTIGSGVTSIGYRVFYSCDSLTSVTIGNSVTSIGNYAFSGCSSLTSVTIGDSVTSIGFYAFDDCYKLVEVINKSGLNIKKGSESNGYVARYALEVHNGESKIVNKDGYLFYALDGTNYLVNYIGTDTDITLPANYNGENYAINDYAFYNNNNNNLTSVTIPDSVTSIGYDAFYNTGYYKNKSNWENGVLYIDKYVIEAKTDISGAYTIKAGTKLIADSAFYSCDSLTSVIIPDSVTSIGNEAFYSCDSLTNVIIPDSVTSIGNEAFEYCSSLRSVTIGNSVTNIDGSAFYNCYKLVEVINKSNLNITKGSYNNGYVAYYALEVHNGKSKIVNKDGYLFYTVDGTNYLVNYIGTDTDITLPANYNGENYVINRYAFYENNSLTNVTIPDSVTSIGEGAFEWCNSLTSVTIPDSVTSIGSYAFRGCSSLTSVEFKNTVGWKTSYTAISSTDLDDKAKAATYLNSTYLFSTWTRS